MRERSEASRVAGRESEMKRDTSVYIQEMGRERERDNDGYVDRERKREEGENMKH